ncbi:MAG: hypothetical protein AB8B50_16815 [Pirellulaceae bacterium]
MPSNNQVQRILLAVCSVSLLALGIVVESTGLIESGSSDFVSGMLLKVGFVLGLAWIAAPQIEKLGWDKLRGPMLIGALMVAILWSLRPRIGLAAGVIFLIATLAASGLSWFRRLSTPPRKSAPQGSKRKVPNRDR